MTAQILRVQKSIDAQIWTKGSLGTAGEIKGTIPAEGKQDGQKSGFRADPGANDMMMKNKVITSSAQKLSSKHLSLVPRPSIFSFSLSSFCPFFPKCLSHVINATDFSKISAHPLQHLLESGSMSHSFLTLNLQLLSQNQEMFLVLWLRERELYPCKRLGSLTVTRSHSISLFLSVPICKLGIIASTFHGAARIK